MFQIDVTGLSWIGGRQDDPEDLCAHGHAVAQIGDETFAYDATVSATALYLTPRGRETLVPRDEYQKTVYAFADKVEAFYQSCGPKVLPSDKLDREGYLAFWNEWHRLRLPGI